MKTITPDFRSILVSMSFVSMAIIRAMLFPAEVHAQTTRYVSVMGDDLEGGSICNDPQAPCRTIKQAVNIASDRDTIVIATGAYTESITIRKSLIIIGDGRDLTIIQAHPEPGMADGRVLHVDGDIEVVIRNVSIRNGFQYGNGNENKGGGIFNEGGKMILSNVSFVDNKAYYGGGIYNFGSARLDTVTFIRNYGDWSGGGMYNEGDHSVVIDQAEFIDNYASLGGGMTNMENTSPVITNSEFTQNQASKGAGLFNIDSNPVITNVRFNSNRAAVGGGIENNGSSPKIVNVRFEGNEALAGGGISNVNESSPILTNVVFSGNLATDSFGGGIYNHTNCSPVLTNVTFSGNWARGTGGAIYNNGNSSPVLVNTLIWNNKAGNSTTSPRASVYNVDDLSVPVISYSLIANSGGSGNDWETLLGTDSSNNIDADPLFILTISPDSAPSLSGDLRLTAESPAINAGDPATDLSVFPVDNPESPIDPDGNPRVQEGRIDIGAYEFGVISSIEDDQVKMMHPAELLKNYPNPFSDHTTIAFQLSVPGQVSIKIFDMLGKEVAVAVNEAVSVGYHEIKVNTNGWKPGVYYYSLQVRGYIQTRQMIHL